MLEVLRELFFRHFGRSEKAGRDKDLSEWRSDGNKYNIAVQRVGPGRLQAIVVTGGRVGEQKSSALMHTRVTDRT